MDQSSELETIRRKAVDEELASWFGSTDRAFSRQWTLYRHLFEDLSKAALGYATSKQMDGREFESGPLDEARAIVTSLHFALDDPHRKNPEAGKQKAPEEVARSRLNFWMHEPRPREKLKAKDVPYMDRPQIEGVAGLYLDLPFRSAAVDRVLVDILLALEMWAFGNEMLNSPTILGQSFSPLKQWHALWAFLVNQVTNAVVFLGIAAFAIYGVDVGWWSHGWGAGAATLFTGAFLLFLGLGTLSLPFTWRRQAQARKRTADMIDTMVAVYAELNSNGPISASHIKGRALDAANKGVLWPGPLFALLDDIERRSGRF